MYALFYDIYFVEIHYYRSPSRRKQTCTKEHAHGKALIRGDSTILTFHGNPLASW